MDKIVLNGLLFYAYHGVLEGEKNLGQKFKIDIELYCDLQGAGTNDDLEKTVNYAQVYKIVKNICAEERYDLIEALAENIAAEVLNNFPLVIEIMVRVKKPKVAIEGILDYVGVEIRRARSE